MKIAQGFTIGQANSVDVRTKWDGSLSFRCTHCGREIRASFYRVHEGDTIMAPCVHCGVERKITLRFDPHGHTAA